MPSIGSLLKSTARGIGRLPRLIGDAFESPEDYGQFQTPPFNPHAAPVNPNAVPPETAPPMPSRRGGWKPLIGDMITGAIAGAATPNVAYGGPVDAFRAMQGGQDAVRQRQIQGLALQRQAAMDQFAASRDEREWKRQQEQERDNRTRNEQADRRLTAIENREPGLISVGGGFLYDPVNKTFIKAPGQEEPMVTVTAEAARQMGYVVPEGATEFSVPASTHQRAIPGFMAGGRQSQAAAALQAKKAQLVSGLVAQGYPEEDAELRADVILAQTIALPPMIGEARIRNINASTANTGVRTTATTTATSDRERKNRIEQLANRVIADDTSGRTENAIKNIMNPEFYTGVTPQERYDVVAEIKRREGRGKKGSDDPVTAIADRIIKGGAAPAPVAAPAAPPQPPQVTPANAPPKEAIDEARPGQIIVMDDGSRWQKQANGTVKEIR